MLMVAVMMMVVAMEQFQCNYKVNTCRFKNETINRCEVQTYETSA